MTQTQNLGLTKFESTDKFRISQSQNSMNKNMELIDAAVGDLTEKSTNAETRMTAMQDGYAILANGNTHPAIANGQAVYVKNHGSLAEGLYWATTAIAANGTLSTSNLSADSTGGLNKLKASIDALNSNSTSEAFTTSLSGVSANHVVMKTGKICRMHLALGNGTVFSEATGYDVIGNVPEGYRPNLIVATEVILGRTSGVWANATYFSMMLRIETNGDLVISGNANEIKQCQYLSGELLWTTN